MSTEFTAEEVRRAVVQMRVVNIGELQVEQMLIAYADTLSKPADSGRVDAKEYLDNCVNALDHIARTARNCRVTSKRLTWIASRAESAINSDDAWRDAPVPQNGASALMRARVRIKELEAALAQNAHGIDHVGELLAVIHGDGGHYAAEHGTQKAAADALVKVHAMMLSIAQNAQGDAVAEVDAGEDGLFVEILYGPDGSPLKIGDKLYLHAERARVPDGAVEVLRQSIAADGNAVSIVFRSQETADRFHAQLDEAMKIEQNAAAPSAPEDAA